MHVLIATKPGVMEIGEAPVPEVGERDLLVETQVSAVSPGTELQRLFEGKDLPKIGGTGYMAAGIVREVGPGVHELRPGDRVQFLCSAPPVGPHSEFCITTPERAVRIPEGMSFLTAACSYWAAPPYRGILGGEVRYYDDVAVVGLGPLGLCAVQMLRHLARRLLALDHNPLRLQMALDLGADLAVNPREMDAAQAAASLMPRGPRVVLEVSGHQSGLEEAMRICAPRGTVVLVGVLPLLKDFQLFRAVQDKGIHIAPIFRQGDTLNPVVSRSYEYTAHVLDMIGRGRLDVDRLATWVVPWTDGPEMIPKLHREHDRAIGLALVWKGNDTGVAP